MNKLEKVRNCEHKGYESELPKLRTGCGCRNPKTRMLIKTAEGLVLTYCNSFMIGDSSVKGER